ncbi:MAG TPA: SMP-30/gluconolactonase/LRE family protein [Polyangia bacterium]|jgi:sugar lactone lactonase YvrE|nr:SMP-30/gluconolactonase/LRE family protein [Polyangia bacterium]
MPDLVQKLNVPVSVLGEGPVWSERDQCLYYVDIISRLVQRYRPHDGEYKSWRFDGYTGSLAECGSGGLILALTDRVVRFDPKNGVGALEEIVVLERDRPQNRLNDGKVDPWGRFWVGSMQADEAARTGRLWCVTGDGRATQHRDNIGVSNSLAFDESRKRMYFADSMTGMIERATVDATPPSPSWTPFAKAGNGSPDGSCTDADGYLWNAEWAGWRIVRYTPSGDIDRVIEMPVSRPSCCTFGGPDYRTLFVTSAQYNMTESEKQKDPNAGSLYCVQLNDVHGVPASQFAA